VIQFHALTSDDRKALAASEFGDMRASEIPEDWQYWLRHRPNRPCFICKAVGWCEHREPEVTSAEAAITERLRARGVVR